MKTCPDAYHCPVEATIDIVGGKHKVLILWHLSKAGVLRFGELQRRMSQATPKMLTQQLRELEADGMVHRELYHQVPPKKAEYSLTQRGVSFVPGPQRHVRLGKTDVLDEVGKRRRPKLGGSGGLTASASRSMLGDAVSASTRRHT